MYGCLASTVFVDHVHAWCLTGPEEGVQISWDQSYRQSSASVWVLGTEPRALWKSKLVLSIASRLSGLSTGAILETGKTAMYPRSMVSKGRDRIPTSPIQFQVQFQHHAPGHSPPQWSPNFQEYPVDTHKTTQAMATGLPGCRCRATGL